MCSTVADELTIHNVIFIEMYFMVVLNVILQVQCKTAKYLSLVSIRCLGAKMLDAK